ncbi:hypothetical protein DAY19_11730 [Halobacteriovorax vibrionivorans]|uniref:Plasmid stabilization protein n=1 Tax=Halobacteriovorax vibrionivorans TaxID=2152716 RepID=A0ABY0ICG9_9BACT|nr:MULTISPECIES: hypothetical protein [Halobacteriovorax]RZF20648.1 hypothetical protein DAY19_11730 [Halobacteriovorax vibrionivorans]TGD48942.1 hypothetical protein EP118_02000 [Halobacteriovorax sp. Y22]
MINIKVTANYLKSLTEIEDYIFNLNNLVYDVEQFHSEHDRVKDFIKQNPTTPAPHPLTGDQSWPFANGRYRIFFKFLTTKNSKLIYLLDIIDNRMLNDKYYPHNSIPTYKITD